MSSFSDWVAENKVREGIYLYHWYKERGANDRALQSLQFALTWRRLTKRAADALPESECPYCHEKYTGTFGDHLLQLTERR